MPLRTTSTLTLAGLSLTACLAAVPALAQQQSNVPATGSDWRVECTNSGKTLDCRVFSEVIESKSRQIITTLTIRYPQETKKPVMMIQVPLGVLVTKAITVAVDNGRPEQLMIQTCTQSGCAAGNQIPEPLIASMSSGKELKIVFYNVNSQPVTVTMPLAGFALAYNKVKG
ncbi:MAG: invasion associated locus B family protein [Pseudolabrys sp.]